MSPTSARAGTTEIRWYGVVVLVGHLGLLALGVSSLWHIAGGWWLGALAGLLFAGAYLSFWRFLLAPGSRQRVSFRERLAYSLVAGAAVLVLGALSTLWLPTLIAISVVILGDALNERSDFPPNRN